MEYYSTDGNSAAVKLRQALTHVIAPDGGLYLPRAFTRLPDAFYNNISDMSISDISYVVANTLFNHDIPAANLRRITSESLPSDIKLRQSAERTFALELFHGPTLSCKDLPAAFVSRVMAYLPNRSSRINVLVASSGDTAAAVAAAFAKVDGATVYIVHPARMISKVTAAQLAQFGKKVQTIAVSGNIDDCAAMVRGVLADSEMVDRYNLVSANSCNVGFLLPQAMCYFYAYSLMEEELRRKGNIVFAVPAANLDNLTGAVIAKRLGLPIKRLIAVSNTNNTFVRYLQDGVFAPRRVVHTIAPSMDVTRPGNFDRLRRLYESAGVRLTDDMEGISFTDDEISATMNAEYERSGVLLDPHSALGCRALEQNLKPDETGIFLATAHPSKYRDSVITVTGKDPGMIKGLNAPPRSAGQNRCAPHVDALKKYLCEHLVV